MLRGRVVSAVLRRRETEVLFEFTDGTRCFVDRQEPGIEVSITQAEKSEAHLSSHQAYLAMIAFLEQQFARGGIGDLGILLGSLSLLQDGRSADVALHEDWNQAVESALAGQVSSRATTRAWQEGPA